MSLNGDASTRGYAGEVIVVVNVENMGDVYERTPDVMSVKYSKECPHCGEVVEAERFAGTPEHPAESMGRAHDYLVDLFGSHLDNDCEGGDGA